MLFDVNMSTRYLNLSNNQLTGLKMEVLGGFQGTYTVEGIAAVAEAIKVNGSLTSVRDSHEPTRCP